MKNKLGKLVVIHIETIMRCLHQEYSHLRLCFTKSEWIDQILEFTY